MWPYALPLALQPLPLLPPLPFPPLLPLLLPFPLLLPSPPPLPARARPGEMAKTAHAMTSATRVRLDPQVKGVAAMPQVVHSGDRRAKGEPA